MVYQTDYPEEDKRLNEMINQKDENKLKYIMRKASDKELMLLFDIFVAEIKDRLKQKEAKEKW